MKKIVVLACLMTVSAGMAIAQQTISIPFFSDNSSVGRSGFVGLQNTGTTTVAVTATFKDNTGAALAGTLALDRVSLSAPTRLLEEVRYSQAVLRTLE